MSKNGLILLTPTSIAYTGTSATISANGSVSFSACSVLSLNGVFSADYDNYMVVWRGKNDSLSYEMNTRLRASGSDATGSNYTYQNFYSYATTLEVARSISNTFFRIGYCGTYQPQGSVAYLYGPYLAQPTASRSVGLYSYSVSDVVNTVDHASTHSLSNSYDGITIFPAGGSITGRVAVYGMRK